MHVIAIEVNREKKKWIHIRVEQNRTEHKSISWMLKKDPKNKQYHKKRNHVFLLFWYLNLCFLYIQFGLDMPLSLCRYVCGEYLKLGTLFVIACSGEQQTRNKKNRRIVYLKGDHTKVYTWTQLTLCCSIGVLE